MTPSDTSDFLRELATKADAAEAVRLVSIADTIEAWDEQDRERMRQTGCSY